MTAPESRCPRAMTDYRRARPVYETYASLDADRETGPFLHADFTDHPSGW